MNLFFDDDWMDGLLKALAEQEGFADYSDDDRDAKTETAILERKRHIRDSLLAEVIENQHDSLVSHRLQIDEFRDRLHQRWYRSLDLLESIIGSLGEIGKDLNTALRSDQDETRRHSVEVLTRIQARSLRIAHEVLCLAANGYAEAAFTRWRSMHELAAIGFVVLNGGEETAERFIYHEVVDAYDGARVHREHATALGIDGPTDDEWNDLKNRRQELIARYGSKYARPYGWISHLIEEKDRCTFAAVERLAGIGHLKPYYAMASRSIHSSPRGLFFDMGVYGYSSNARVLSVGPSNYGLADPLQFCAISLLQSTVALVQLRPTVSLFAAIEAVNLLLDRLQIAASETQSEIEREELQVRNTTPGSGDRDRP